MPSRASVAACAAIGSAGAGPAWKSRSTSAEARYSTVAKPWSKLRAAISRSISSRGIGAPVAAWRACASSTSGVSSQCS